IRKSDSTRYVPGPPPGSRIGSKLAKQKLLLALGPLVHAHVIDHELLWQVAVVDWPAVPAAQSEIEEEILGLAVGVGPVVVGLGEVEGEVLNLVAEEVHPLRVPLHGVEVEVVPGIVELDGPATRRVPAADGIVKV